MISSLCLATHNFIKHQLREQSQETQTLLKGTLWHATIPLIGLHETRTAHFYFMPAFMDLVCMAMLGEEACDEETLCDFVQETTNQIAGSAKIVAVETQGTTYTIGIPEVLGLEPVESNGTVYAFSIDNTPMLYIALH